MAKYDADIYSRPSRPGLKGWVKEIAERQAKLADRKPTPHFSGKVKANDSKVGGPSWSRN